MTTTRHVAVIDVGKTNAKVALVDLETGTEIAVEKHPNQVLTTGPWPHYDMGTLWAFALEGLTDLHKRHGVDAIAVTTHGAAAAFVVPDGQLAAPVLDYEHDGPNELATSYGALRPDFSLTGSPRLPAGLNLGAQIHWQCQMDHDLLDRTRFVLPYPQLWGYWLTGVAAADVTSLGCHTDLWLPRTGTYSTLVQALGLSEKIPKPCLPGKILGPLMPEISARTGLPISTPVVAGIHDSNASLVPYLGMGPEPVSILSTGTWVIAMAMNAPVPDLSMRPDCLLNTNALGYPVPSARFMGGREFEHASREDDNPTALDALSRDLATRALSRLNDVGAQGPIIVEGPFANNQEFLNQLHKQRKQPIYKAGSATGTSVGAAMLFTDIGTCPPTGLLRHDPWLSNKEAGSL